MSINILRSEQNQLSFNKCHFRSMKYCIILYGQVKKKKKKKNNNILSSFRHEVDIDINFDCLWVNHLLKNVTGIIFLLFCSALLLEYAHFARTSSSDGYLLTHLCLASHKWETGEQCRPRWASHQSQHCLLEGHIYFCKNDTNKIILTPLKWWWMNEFTQHKWAKIASMRRF